MHVVRAAGFASEGYVRLKLASARAFITRLIVTLCDVPEKSPLAHGIGAIIEAWASRHGFDYDPAAWEIPLPETAKSQPVPRFADFLLAYDVKFRERRLNFLIEGQNRLYELLDSDAYRGLEAAVVDRLKGALYVRLDDIRRRQNASELGPEIQQHARAIFATAPSAAELKELDIHANNFVAQYGQVLDRLMDEIARALDLEGATGELDALIAGLDQKEWHHQARRYVMINYLGFSFWDVLTFPMMVARDGGELNQILIDRISPQDVKALEGFEGLASLKGSGLGRFGAFLSRSYRENDYLLGRLHALERLIDIVCDSADAQRSGVNVMQVKKRGFLRILAAEEPHLTHSASLIAQLRARIAELK
jgi:hypothetical protein